MRSEVEQRGLGDVKPAYFQRLWHKIFHNPAYSSDQEEKRAIHGLHWLREAGFNVIDTSNAAEEDVSVNKALRVATIYSCLNVLAESVATMPVSVMEENEDGNSSVRKDLIQHYLIHRQPNEYMSNYNFWYSMVFMGKAWGNSYAYIRRDELGEHIGYYPLMPWEVSIQLVEGDLFYIVNGVPYPARDILHFRFYSHDGLTGLSPIEQNAETTGAIIRQNRYTARALGAKPPGMASPKAGAILEDKNTEQLFDQINRYGSDPDSVGKIQVFSIPLDVQHFMIPPGDAEYVETRKLTRQDIYGIYRIPPSFLQDYENSSDRNTEQQDLVFVKHTLLPILESIQGELNCKIFNESNKRDLTPLYTEFDVDRLLKADIKTRFEAYEKALFSGWMNRNEVRAAEKKGKIEHGDIYTVQGAMINLAWVAAAQQGVNVDMNDESVRALERLMKEVKDFKVNGRMNGHHIEV